MSHPPPPLLPFLPLSFSPHSHFKQFINIFVEFIPQVRNVFASSPNPSHHPHTSPLIPPSHFTPHTTLTLHPSYHPHTLPLTLHLYMQVVWLYSSTPSLTPHHSYSHILTLTPSTPHTLTGSLPDVYLWLAGAAHLLQVVLCVHQP